MPIDPLTLAFALVAIVVIWRLRSVLGERTGNERTPPRDMFQSKPQPGPQRADPVAPNGGFADRNVIRLPGATPAANSDPDRWRGIAEPSSPVAAGLDAIAAADPTFSAGPFLDGAKTAYEAIVTAFSSGERKMLQSLLARDVYDGFAAAIAEREKQGHKLTTTFVSMDDATIEGAALEGRTARITVRFRSKQISATHDANGKLVEGGPDRVVEMNDVWTFAREVTSRDPNWKLVATQAGH